MTFKQSFLDELGYEAKTTRKFLERVPVDKFDWKPHEKSMNLMQLAVHVAEIPGWISMVLNTSELDFKKSEYKPVVVKSQAELTEYFQKTMAEGKTALQNTDDKHLISETWTMRSGDKIHFSSSKLEMIRYCFCQEVHHRAQLGVYLRLLNVPIPGSYGPSADEPEF